MASSSKRNESEGSFGVNMVLICAEADIPPLIFIERIMEAMGGPIMHG